MNSSSISLSSNFPSSSSSEIFPLSFYALAEPNWKSQAEILQMKYEMKNSEIEKPELGMKVDWIELKIPKLFDFSPFANGDSIYFLRLTSTASGSLQISEIRSMVLQILADFMKECIIFFGSKIIDGYSGDKKFSLNSLKFNRKKEISCFNSDILSYSPHYLFLFPCSVKCCDHCRIKQGKKSLKFIKIILEHIKKFQENENLKILNRIKEKNLIQTDII